MSRKSKNTTSVTHRPRIGLALGSGAARGWAHVGVIRALEQAGVRPDLVCGTSIGALVGAVYAAGELDRFEQWLLGLGIADVLSFMDVHLNGGMIKGERLMDFFRRTFIDRPVEDLALPFGAVATALHSGAEIWLREGSTIDAVRASIALPALFTPVLREGRILVDGGLVNPVPVSLARAMGADVVIAVDLSSDILGRHLQEEEQETADGEISEWVRKLQENFSILMPAARADDAPRPPSMLDVVASSVVLHAKWHFQSLPKSGITRRGAQAMAIPLSSAATRLGHFWEGALRASAWAAICGVADAWNRMTIPAQPRLAYGRPGAC